MTASASLELVWTVAAHEAIAGQFRSIEPEHFCMALLKFSELPVSRMRELSPDAEVAGRLAADMEAVCRELAARSIDTTAVRRELRRRLGAGGHRYEGGPVHRSEDSRKLFDVAGATGEQIVPLGLLRALLADPTPAMAEVLGGAVAGLVVDRSLAPLLAECGRDAADALAGGAGRGGVERPSEGKALVRVLAGHVASIAMLITDDDDAAAAVVATAARAVIAGDCPANLRGKRIADVRETGTGPGRPGRDDRGIERLLVQAAAVPEVILFVPSLLPAPDGKGLGEWGRALKTALLRYRLRCVCRVPPAAYTRWVEKDTTWRRLAEGIWVHEGGTANVPSKL